MPVEIIEKALRLKERGLIRPAMKEFENLRPFAQTKEDMIWIRDQINKLNMKLKKPSGYEMPHRVAVEFN